MLSFLAPRLKNALAHVNLNLLYELRIRTDKPLRVNAGGSFTYLGEAGLTEREELAIRPTAAEVEETLFAASGYSVYAVENQLKKGFVTGKDGERIGIAGTLVYEGGSVLSVHSVTSLCVRVPHAVEGCAEEIYRKTLADGLRSLLILAPPGEGKTTLLRDLTRIVSQRTQANILVATSVANFRRETWARRATS